VIGYLSQDRLKAGQGLLSIRQGTQVQTPQAQTEGDPLLAFGEVLLLTKDVRQILIHAAGLVETIQRGQGGQVIGGQGDDFLVHLDGLARLVQVNLEKLGHLHHGRQTIVQLRRARDLPVQDLQQLRPVLTQLINRRQPHQGLTALGLLCEHGTPDPLALFEGDELVDVQVGQAGHQPNLFAAREAVEHFGVDFGEGFPVPGGLGELLQPGDDRVVLRVDDVGLRTPVERGLGLVQLLLADHHQFLQVGQTLGWLRAGGQQDLDHAGDLLPATGFFINRQQQGRGPGVARFHLEDALVGLDRALWFLQPVGEDIGDLEEQLDLLVGGRGRLGAVMQRLDVADPVFAIGEEPFERLPVPVGAVQLLEDLHGLGMTGTILQHGLPRAHGDLPGGAHLVGQDRAGLLQQGQRLVAHAHGDLATQHLHQGRKPLLAFIQRNEALERVDVVGIELEHAVPHLDREHGVPERLLGKAGQVDELLPLLVLGHQVDFLQLQLEQALPVAPLLVDVLERGDGLEIGGVHLEDLLEGLGRLVGVGQLRAPQVRDLLEIILLFRRIGLAGVLLLVDHDHVAPTAHGLVLLGQGVHGPWMVRIQLQDGVVDVDHHGVDLHLLLDELRHVHQDRDAPGDVVGRQRVLDVLVQFHQGVPLLAPEVQILERVDRRGVHLVHLQDALPHVDGLLRALVDRDLRDPARQFDALVHVVGDGTHGLLQHGQVPHVVILGHVVLAVEVHHQRGHVVALAQLGEVLLCGVEVADLLPPQHAQLQAHLLGVGAVLELALVQGDQVLPLLLLRERLHQQHGGLLHARDELCHLLQVFLGQLGLMRVLQFEVGDLEQAGSALLGVRDAGQLLPQEIGQLRIALLRAIEILDVLDGVRVARIHLERLFQKLFDTVEVRPVLGGHLRGPEVHVRGPLGLRRTVGLGGVLLEHLLPVAGFLFQGFEPGDRLIVLRIELGDPSIHPQRLHAQPQLLVEHPGDRGDQLQIVGLPALGEPVKPVRQLQLLGQESALRSLDQDSRQLLCRLVAGEHEIFQLLQHVIVARGIEEVRDECLDFLHHFGSL